MPGKNINSDRVPIEDNSTLLSHNNLVIKEEVEDETTVPSNAFSEVKISITDA